MVALLGGGDRNFLEMFAFTFPVGSRFSDSETTVAHIHLAHYLSVFSLPVLQEEQRAFFAIS